MPDKINDPENYSAMRVPHESPEAAAEAYEAFWGEVYEARKRHRISEVVLIVGLRGNPQDPSAGFVLTGSMGDAQNAPHLVATALRMLKQAIIDDIDEAAAMKPKARKKRKEK